MTNTDWHAPLELLARFVDQPGAIDDTTASSIEAHLVVCSECRQQLTAAADPACTAASWDEIADRIDRPRPTPLERILAWFGMGHGFARLVAATPSLQAAGLFVITFLAAAAAVVSRIAGAEGPFLVFAPLAPLGAVAASFAPLADPAGEAGVATPLHGAGLVVRRAVAVLIVTFVMLGVAALALPDLGPAAAAWVLPALALSLGTLALGTWLRVEMAVAVIAGGWLASMWSFWWAAGRANPIVDSTIFTTAGQLTAFAATLAAVVVIVARRDRFTILEAVS